MAGSITNYLARTPGAPSGAPDLPATEWGFNQRDDTASVDYWNLLTLDWETLAGAVADYPKRATLWHDESLVTVGSALLLNHDSACNYGLNVLQDTSANGDTFTQSFLLEGGTYTFECLGMTAVAEGKIDWYLDNVLAVSGQDWYSGSTVRNVIKTASVTVVGGGRHVLKGVVNGKNASSSGYNIQLTTMSFYPSAD